MIAACAASVGHLGMGEVRKGGVHLLRPGVHLPQPGARVPSAVLVMAATSAGSPPVVSRASAEERVASVVAARVAGAGAEAVVVAAEFPFIVDRLGCSSDETRLRGDEDNGLRQTKLQRAPFRV